MSAFNPGDTLTISTESYKRRRFTVLESNGHRTVLRGSKGSHRVLVFVGPDRLREDGTYSIHEDDGEKNRGRPCTVDAVERGWVDAAAKDMAQAVTLPAGASITVSLAPPVPVEPRSVARARMLDTEWGIASTNNRMAAGEALAEAMTKLLEGDLSGARASAESAARKLTTAKVFEYVARTESRNQRRASE